MSYFGYEDIIKAVKSDNWCVHAYYTISPWSPDNSGKLLFAGCDLGNNTNKVYIADKDGNIVDSFGDGICTQTFYHTGRFQTWSPDGKSVYYQGETPKEPIVIKRVLENKKEYNVRGDMEGAPPFGEPIIGGAQGMLYAAGYGTGIYNPDISPYPFDKRDEHGLFKFYPESGKSELALSINDILSVHPHRDTIIKIDKELQKKFGTNHGLTLMCYCVRWNTTGDKLLFYFGNHCQVRGEPKHQYIFTCDKNMNNINLALDLSNGNAGCHISWHPDGNRLVGYGPRPDDKTRPCLMHVNYDGSDYIKISDHASGGHSSVCPSDYNFIVTDDIIERDGKNISRIVFIDARSGKEFKEYILPKCAYGDPKDMSIRNSRWICHHAVFDKNGEKILFNAMENNLSQLFYISII